MAHYIAAPKKQFLDNTRRKMTGGIYQCCGWRSLRQHYRRKRDADQPMMPVPIISERHNPAIGTKIEADANQNSDTLEHRDYSKAGRNFSAIQLTEAVRHHRIAPFCYLFCACPDACLERSKEKVRITWAHKMRLHANQSEKEKS